MKRNTIKLLLTLLALCLVLAALPGTALAVTVSFYEIKDGMLYYQEDGAIGAYDIHCTALDIPNVIDGVTITIIDGSAFEGCSSLTSVTIPNSVTTIRKNAFKSCSSLTSITIPNSVTTIEEGAFSDCKSLTGINVSSGNSNYISVDGTLFNAGQTLLHTYPAGKRNISYSIPDSVTTIESYAFAGCSNLTSVTIPNSVTSIRGNAFEGCSSLTSVTIPNSVTSIQGDTFKDCSSLTSVTIPNSVTTIGGRAFNDCSGLTSLTIPNSVTSIGGWAFNDCSSLTSLTIPNSVTSIGEWAFRGCSSLTDIYYGGSQADWEKISWEKSIIGDDKNQLMYVTIHYNNAASQQLPASPTNSVSVTVNGTAVQWPDAAPFIDENGRTMVPLRAVADAIGLTVNWDANAREASFTDGGKTIIFPIGSNAARTGDGQTVTMNTAAVIVNGRTYAPVRYLAEFFGYTVGWDAASRNVLIAP